jgi:protein TonB
MASRRRMLVVAVCVSIGVHLLAAGVIGFLPRFQPRDTEPREQGTVELVMVAKKGLQPKQATPSANREPAPPDTNEMPKSQTMKADIQKEQAPALTSTIVPEPAVTQYGNNPGLLPTEPESPKAVAENSKPDRKQVEVQPTPPQSQKALVFDFEGNGSEANAIANGDQILPAMRDSRFRNRYPDYPIDAAARGEHGAVSVMIHVSENGIASGVDVLESSGFKSLDRAAVDAVQKWRFHPAMKAGLAVPFDMAIQFNFLAN